jgi:hypothetical protein
MIYGTSGTTCLNKQRHISSAAPLWGSQTHTINTLRVQCKVLSVTSGRTQENLLALKGCTNEATVNIHYRQPATFFFARDRKWGHYPDWTRRTVEMRTLLLRIFRIPQIEDELQFWKIIFRKKIANKNTSLCVKFIIILGRPHVLVG